uniref:Uncharacterized protein n=1 Tax=Beauveria bassiana TaxID=176275 RepID=D1FVF4_BEABA|nr:hypothetical protein [Beauveria bassiana]
MTQLLVLFKLVVGGFALSFVLRNRDDGSIHYYISPGPLLPRFRVDTRHTGTFSRIFRKPENAIFTAAIPLLRALTPRRMAFTGPIVRCSPNGTIFNNYELSSVAYGRRVDKSEFFAANFGTDATFNSKYYEDYVKRPL